MAKSNKLWMKTAFNKVPKLYSTENQGDNARAFVKFFSNFSDRRDYILEYDPEEGIAFALTTENGEQELGYISIPEMQEVNDNFRKHRFPCPPIQREMHGTPKEGYRIGDVKEGKIY